MSPQTQIVIDIYPYCNHPKFVETCKYCIDAKKLGDEIKKRNARLNTVDLTKTLSYTIERRN